MARPTEHIRTGIVVCLITLALLAIVEGIFRARETPQARFGIKPVVWEKPGAYRIAAIGGSTVLGAQQLEMGFVIQLRSELMRLEPDKPIETINLGRSSAASDYARGCVEYLAGLPAAERPDLLIVMTAHNEFLSGVKPEHRTTGFFNPHHFALTRAIIRRAARRTQDATPATWTREDVLPERLYPYDRDSKWFRQRLEGYRANIESIIETATSNNISLIMCSAPSNVADWPPVYHNIEWTSKNKSYEQEMDGLVEMIKDGDPATVEQRCQRLLNAYGRDAMVLYLLGRSFYLRGRYDEARRSLLTAKDLDPYPWRVLSNQNSIVKRLAVGDGVLFVDVDKVFSKRAKGGIVGFDLIGDNVHPTPFGNAVIVGVLTKRMAEANLFLRGDYSFESEEERLVHHRQFLKELKLPFPIPPEEWIMRSAIYSMKTPFYYYDAARDYLERAGKMRPRRWDIWGNLGVLDLFEGNIEAGIEHLKKARALRKKDLDPNHRGRVLYLKEALQNSGVSLSEFQPDAN